MTAPIPTPPTPRGTSADLLTVASLRAAALEEALTDCARAELLTGEECVSAVSNLRKIGDAVTHRQVVEA